MRIFACLRSNKEIDKRPQQTTTMRKAKIYRLGLQEHPHQTEEKIISRHLLVNTTRHLYEHNILMLC